MPGMCNSVMESKLKGTGSKNRSGVFYVPSYIKDPHSEYKKEPWLAKKNWIFKSHQLKHLITDIVVCSVYKKVFSNPCY